MPWIAIGAADMPADQRFVGLHRCSFQRPIWATNQRDSWRQRRISTNRLAGPAPAAALITSKSSSGFASPPPFLLEAVVAAPIFTDGAQLRDRASLAYASNTSPRSARSSYFLFNFMRDARLPATSSNSSAAASNRALSRPLTNTGKRNWRVRIIVCARRLNSKWWRCRCDQVPRPCRRQTPSRRRKRRWFFSAGTSHRTTPGFRQCEPCLCGYHRFTPPEEGNGYLSCSFVYDRKIFRA